MFQQGFVAPHPHRGGDVVALGLAHQRVEQEPVDLLQRDLLQVLVGAVHRVAGLEPDHGAPAAVAKSARVSVGVSR